MSRYPETAVCYICGRPYLVAAGHACGCIPLNSEGPAGAVNTVRADDRRPYHRKASHGHSNITCRLQGRPQRPSSYCRGVGGCGSCRRGRPERAFPGRHPVVNLPALQDAAEALARACHAAEAGNTFEAAFAAERSSLCILTAFEPGSEQAAAWNLVLGAVDAELAAAVTP